MILRRTPQSSDWLGAQLMLLLVASALVSNEARATKYAAEFLKLGVGARALGMGGAFVALADDASAGYWNPAGLAQLERGELLAMHSEQFGGLANHDFLSFAQPLEGDRHASVGIGLVRFSVDDIRVTRDAFQDLNGNGERDPGEPILTERFRTESDTEYALLLSYAREAGDGLFLGGNAKLLRQGLLDNTSFGLGLDLGVLYRLRPELTLGGRLSDATGTRLSWDTGHSETVDPSLTVGARWSRELASVRGSITAGGDVGLHFDNREAASQIGSGAFAGDLQGGLEYWYDHLLAARLGSDAGNLTAGAGVRVTSLSVDYAYLSNEELDDTHRVSASFRF